MTKFFKFSFLVLFLCMGFFSVTTFAYPGERDTGFVIGNGFNGTVLSLTVQSDGKILAGGGFTAYSGTTTNRIVRLNTDGTLDTGFNIGSGFDNTANTIALQSDGKILAGGSFTTYSGVTAGSIIRIYGTAVELLSILLSYLNGSYQRENLTLLNYSFGTARKAFVNAGETHAFILNFINNIGSTTDGTQTLETPFHFRAPVQAGIGSGGTGNTVYKVKFFTNP